MTLGTEATNKDVVDYWNVLQEDYRSNSENEEQVYLDTLHAVVSKIYPIFNKLSIVFLHSTCKILMKSQHILAVILASL